MPENTSGQQKSKAVKVNLKAEWSIFSWCLVLAFILWILTGLSDNYVRVINVKATYSNIPKDKVYVRPLPAELKVQVNASGWDLFTMWLRNSTEEVNIDLSTYAKKAYIATNLRLKDELRTKLTHKMVINSIEPDTIYLNREARASRKVPVVLKLQINCDKNYALSEKIKASPEFVTVSGPVSLINQMEYIETRDTILEDIDKSASYQVGLKQPAYSSLSFDTSNVNVKVSVSELIDAKTTVSVNAINKRGRQVQVSPGKVVVLYKIPKSKEKKIRTSLFEVVVDASLADSAGNAPLKVQMLNHPDYTYNFHFKPETVNVKIKK